MSEGAPAATGGIPSPVTVKQEVTVFQSRDENDLRQHVPPKIGRRHEGPISVVGAHVVDTFQGEGHVGHPAAARLGEGAEQGR